MSYVLGVPWENPVIMERGVIIEQGGKYEQALARSHRKITKE
jgi:hypothetical protein